MAILFRWPWLSGAMGLVGLGFGVSGIQNHNLAYFFWGLAILFLLPPVWSQISRISIVPSYMNPAPGKTDFDRRMKGIFVGIVVLLLLTWLGILYLYTKPMPHPLHDAPLRESHGVNFVNQEVKIDGNSYFDCTFTDVTFIYDGTTHFRLDRYKLNGHTKLKTTSFETRHVLEFLYAMGGLKNGFEVEVKTP